jgi:hypothetical protein
MAAPGVIGGRLNYSVFLLYVFDHIGMAPDRVRIRVGLLNDGFMTNMSTGVRRKIWSNWRTWVE